MTMVGRFRAVLRRAKFPGSDRYWEERYAAGGTSGPGSYGAAAKWKAQVVNDWVHELGATSVIDWGCGDGHQLTLADYPRYLGVDRSPSAVKRCISLFENDPTKSFMTYRADELHDPAGWLRADLALSMEVIFHLTEEETYVDYMDRLFNSARAFVVICSNDESGTEEGPTERHWRFTEWVETNAPQWTLRERIEPPEDLDAMSQMYLFTNDSPGTLGAESS